MGKVGLIPWHRVVWMLLLILMAAVSAQAEGAGQRRVRADLERFIQSRMGDPSATIEVPRLAAFAVDRARNPGGLRTELSSKSKPPFSGRVPITVTLFAGDRLIKRSVVSPYVLTVVSVVVPSRDLRRGEILVADDLKIAEQDVERTPDDVIDQIGDAIGLRMKRSVREGRVLRRSQVEGVPVVERGDRVMLVLRSGLIEVQAVGRSREAGVAGDWIRVVNLDSRRELSGRVDQRGRVHVAF